MYEFTINSDGLYSLYVRPARTGQDSTVPEFVRPPALTDQDACQTTGYRVPTIQVNHTNGHECVIMDRTVMQTAVRLIKDRNEPIIFLHV